jgi:hypothetical protein
MDGAVQYRDYDPLLLISSFNNIPLVFGPCGQESLFPSSSAKKFGFGPGTLGFYASVRPAHQQLMVNVYVIF